MLAPLIPGFVGQPHGAGSLFLDWICPCKQMFPRMFALLEMDGFQHIREAMVADWEAKHREWRHVDQRPLFASPTDETHQETTEFLRGRGLYL